MRIRKKQAIQKRQYIQKRMSCLTKCLLYQALTLTCPYLLRQRLTLVPTSSLPPKKPKQPMRLNIRPMLRNPRPYPMLHNARPYPIHRPNHRPIKQNRSLEHPIKQGQECLHRECLLRECLFRHQLHLRSVILTKCARCTMTLVSFSNVFSFTTIKLKELAKKLSKNQRLNYKPSNSGRVRQNNIPMKNLQWKLALLCPIVHRQDRPDNSSHIRRLLSLKNSRTRSHISKLLSFKMAAVILAFLTQLIPPFG